MCTCIKLFLRPPLTQCYFCQFYRNFDKLWIIRKKLDTRNRNPNRHYLDEVQAGSGTVTHQEIYACLYVFAILYCMADDVLKTDKCIGKPVRSCITA